MAESKRFTMPYGIRGRFTLKTPWVAAPDKVYTVIAQRGFQELIFDNVNIFKDYYEPKGLTEEDYKADLRQDTVLIILYSEAGEVIHVPDTYILSYPSQDVPPYANYVLSAMMGPFRTDYDFSFVSQKVSEIISDCIGVEPKVYIDSVGEATAMDSENADRLEAGRVAAIKCRQTTYAMWLKERADNAELRENITVLENEILRLQALVPAK